MGAPLTLVIGNKNYSSWSLRAWLFLKVNGIEFEEIRLPLDTPEFYERIGDYSPSRTVPVLIHDGLKVWDSLAIMAYVHRTFELTVTLPEEPKMFSRALSIMMEMHSGFPHLRQYYPMNCRLQPFTAPVRPKAASDIERIDQLWSECLHESGGPYLFKELTAADIYYAPVVIRMHSFSLPLSDISKEYVNTMLALPELQPWLEAAHQELEIVEADEWHD